MLIGGILLGAVVSVLSYIITWSSWEIGSRIELARKLRGARSA
jgi:hypothetical protein